MFIGVQSLKIKFKNIAKKYCSCCVIIKKNEILDWDFFKECYNKHFKYTMVL